MRLHFCLFSPILCSIRLCAARLRLQNHVSSCGLCMFNTQRQMLAYVIHYVLYVTNATFSTPLIVFIFIISIVLNMFYVFETNKPNWRKKAHGKWSIVNTFSWLRHCKVVWDMRDSWNIKNKNVCNCISFFLSLHIGMCCWCV